MNLNLVAIAFRIINFVLFIYAAWYLFKKYAQQSIEDEISQQEAQREQLVAQHGSLEESTDALKNEHVALQTTIKELKDKARVWQSQTNQQAQQAAAENQYNLEQLVHALKRKELNYKEHTLRMAAFEGAIEIAEQQMRQSINKEKTTVQMQDIIEKLTK